jgi:hypothetical protein
VERIAAMIAKILKLEKTQKLLNSFWRSCLSPRSQKQQQPGWDQRDSDPA